MALKDVDIGWALRRLAERRIEGAIQEGKFDNLPGAGKPLDLEPIPADENARLMYWALRIMKNNDFTSHEVQWRKQIEQLKSELSKARDEQRVQRLVMQINLLVKKLNTLGTNAISSAVVGVSLEVELDRLQAQSTQT